ncbi:MAG TPA: Lrp/AsnC family transcriptional regulator [Burkholderiaceae bacterium]|jgi:DNA-binding Lrp family transcriptional regulator|nr:Lrp/AsnC family transcriptional regulator [Burkholderiaceae bacterium]
MNADSSSETLDPTDLRVLEQLQRDAAVSNQQLAERLSVSPATSHRRVRRLQEIGVIERQVAVLSPQRLKACGAGALIAIVEVTLDIQSAERIESFEARAVADAAVQQCYRVSPGPDFVLVLAVADMEHYEALARRLFTDDANVRNVRSYFSVKRAKFGTELPLPGLPGLPGAAT